MNSLYIGLGGAGIASVATYAKMAQGKEVNRNDEFLYLDTDEYPAKQFPIMGNDFVLLGGGQMSLDTLIRRERYDLSGSDISKKKQAQQFFSWFYVTANDNRSCNPLNIGSGANRMAARAMLFYDYNNVKNRIANKLTYADENGNQQIREVFVVASTCGGTGSGIVLDILYVIQEIFQALMLAQHPFINLLLIMPEGYIRELGPQDVRYSKYCSNAYALFDEINACLKDYYYDFHGDDVNNAGMRWYKHRCFDDGTPPVGFHVFNNAILFDPVDPSTGEPLTSAQRSANVSNFLFIMESAKDTQDNLNTTISNQNRSCKFGSRNRPFIEGFSASGILVAQSWEELTRKYVKEKFIYQMLYHGFIGSGEELEPKVLENDIRVFAEEIDCLISDFQSLIHEYFSDSLESVGRKELYHIVDAIKWQVNNKDTRVFEDVFYSGGVRMDMELNRLSMQVKDLTCSLCVEWATRYNLNHALQLFERLDFIWDIRWKEMGLRIQNAELKLLPFVSIGKNRNDVLALFTDLVKYFVYRNLSDNGYLDDCREHLREAIGSIDLNHFEMTYGVSVGTWEHHYIKYLMALNYDSTKSVWPNLDELLDSEHACLRKNNQVERDYASLVLQDGKGPDMSCDLENNRLLYSYKSRCVEELDGDDEKWSTCYMDFMEGTDRDGIRKAFGAYAQKVKQKAEELANAPELSKPFAAVFRNLSSEEQRVLTDKLNSFDSISLSTHSHLQRPLMSLYLADFNSMPGLQWALAMGRLPAMNNHFVQSTDQIDRVEKLNVEFGYTPVDNRYYDRYKAEFERCLQIPERIRDYQPFIDKRFLFNRKEGETLADMFLREAEQDRRIAESDKD